MSVSGAGSGPQVGDQTGPSRVETAPQQTTTRTTSEPDAQRTADGDYGATFDPDLPDTEHAPVDATQAQLLADNVQGADAAGMCHVDATPAQRADELLESHRQGNISPDELVSQARDAAADMPPADRETFYRTLSQGVEGQNLFVGEGGQCYQSGNITAETPTQALRVPLHEAFQHEADRAAFADRMEQTLGVSGADPNDHDQVRAYLDAVSRERGPQGVQQELNSYMTSFYTHGWDVNYHPPGTDWTTNPPNIGDIQNETLQDGAGRRVIDCDGYATVAESLTRGIDGGRYDFHWGYTSGPGGAHMLGAVVDRQSGEGFVIDNNETDATFRRREGETDQDAVRRGMQDSLNTHHNGQNITSGGLGVGGDYTTAVQSQAPVTGD